MQNLYQRIARQAETSPSAVAIVDGNKQLSYRDLIIQTERLTECLRPCIQHPETMVPVILNPCWQLVPCILAIWRLGAVYLPILPDSPVKAIQHKLADCNAGVVLSDQNLPEQLAYTSVVVNISNIFESGGSASAPVSVPPVPLADNSLAYVIYTSGSSGREKGVMIQHAGFINLVNWYITQFKISAQSRVLLIVPPGSDASLKNILSPLLSGATLVIPELRRYNPLHVLETIASQHITHLNCVPSAFYPVLQLSEKTDYRQLASLQHLILGGERINTELLKHWFANSPDHCQLSNLYGPTEATDIATVHIVSQAEIRNDLTIPIGKAIPNVSLLVTSEHASAPDEGELCIGGPGVARAYLNNASLSKSRFFFHKGPQPGRYYRTGDLVRKTTDGSLLFIGRIDNQLKIRGLRVEREAIEKVLLASGQFSNLVVLPDSGSPPQLHAFYVAAREPQLSPLKQHFTTELPAYLFPASWTRMDSLPLQSSGKLDTAALQQTLIDKNK